MTSDQHLDMQTAVERIAFEMHDIQERVLRLEIAARHEDVRKRVFRTAMTAGIAAMLAMQWWGFSEIIMRLGGV